MNINLQSAKFLEMQLSHKNEIKILTSFYYELKRQKFALKIYDGEHITKLIRSMNS